MYMCVNCSVCEIVNFLKKLVYIVFINVHANLYIPVKDTLYITKTIRKDMN